MRLSRVEGWPVVTSENISVGNPESQVVIPTLWTKFREVTAVLDKSQYAICGQLYSRYGVNLALRNWLSNTAIRDVIVCGADLSGSGEALLYLFENGVDNDRRVRGSEKTLIDEEIPLEAIDRLRESVSVHDLRGLKNRHVPESVKNIIAGLPTKEPWGKPVHYPLPESKFADQFPSEKGAHIVRGETISQVWLKILNEIMLFGEDAYTNYGNQARDLSNLVAIVTDEDPKNPQIVDYFDFTPADIKTYIDEFLDPYLPLDLFYTYGERLLAWSYIHGDIDQLSIVLDKLKKDPNDRGAVAILYHPIKDNQIDRNPQIKAIRTSCILSYQFSIKNEALELTAVFRSNDMWGAWPRNAIGLRHLQGVVADQLGYSLGSLVTVSTRAHLYDEAWSRVKGILDKHGHTIHRSFEEDPRGSYRIMTKESGQIRIVHMDSAGSPLRSDLVGDGLRNRASLSLERELLRRDGVLLPGHAMYLGREMLAAEIAAKLGLPYIQDSGNVITELEKLFAEHRQEQNTKNLTDN